MPTNNERVASAAVALTAFEQAVDAAEVEVDGDAVLVDLLADLQQWADANGIHWERALRQAAIHHLAENDAVEAVETIVWRDPGEHDGVPSDELPPSDLRRHPRPRVAEPL